MEPHEDAIGKLSGIVRGFLFVFGLIPLGIGVTVLIFLWTQSGFGAPPLFFRVFGSIIAVGFILMGCAMAASTVLGRPGAAMRRLRERAGAAPPPAARGGYTCPRCGAPLAADAQVSPHGDVECGYCDAWFNVHGRG